MLKIIADDYGMAPEIDQAILNLAKTNKVHKVSIMANQAYTPAPLPANIETGLHIDLTTSRSLAHPGQTISPRHLLLKPPSESYLVEQITAQLDLLESHQFKIQYLDTHQHVHIVPRILQALIHIANTHQILNIRCLTMQSRHFSFYCKSLIQFGFASQLKKMLPLYAVGRIMARKLKRADIAYCANLVIMPLAGNGKYLDLLKSLRDYFSNKDAEFVTHPSFKIDLADESYTNGREIEYQALDHVG